MSQLLRVLLIEDSRADASPILRELEQAGYQVVCEQVENEASLEAMLREKPWDIIFCDYKMSLLTVQKSLQILKKSGLDIPFMVISGAIGEVAAVECMRAGACDFILKNNLSRLVPAVARELKEREIRQALQRAEALFEKNEGFLQRMMNPSNIGVVRWKFSGEIYKANQAFLDIVGYTQDDLEKGLLNWRNMTPPEGIVLAKQGWEEFRRTGSFVPYEKQYIRKDGTRVDVLVSLANLETSPEEGIGIVLDIQEQNKQSVQALFECEARFHAMAATTSVLIWMSDPTGACTYFNKKWLEFTGRTADQELDNGWLENVHPDDKEPYKAAYLAAFNARQYFEMEYRLHRADGEYRWLRVQAVPRSSPNGAFLGYIGSCVDITELKQTKEELERLVTEKTAQLQAVNQELEAFSYSVSHDLRAPLRAIDGFSQALMEGSADRLDDQGKHYLNRVRQASQQMGQLINDMLQLSRLTRGQMTVVTVDLSRIAQKIASELQEQQPDRQVHFEIADNIVVQGDLSLLQAVMQNLLDNAWKYTSKHDTARIEFGMTEHEGRPAYFVRDDGAGFDMQYAQKLFGAFQRLHGTTEFPGTGVGLATVARIIHRHGGKIWAEAEVEKGATFYFTLDHIKEIARAEK